MNMSSTESVEALGRGMRSIGAFESGWYEKNKLTDAGRLYDKVQRLREERKVFETTPFPKTPTTIRSPNLNALVDLFGPDDHGHGSYSGLVYALYDKPGSGKTHAGRALLQEIYEFPDGKTLKGIMFSGDKMSNNIPAEVCQMLGADIIDGWLYILLLAMNRADHETPSILIIDNFNSAEEFSVNLQFIKALYSIMNAKMNIFVVILTQNKAVAQAIIDCNLGCRTRPLPRCFDGPLRFPQWKERTWSNEQLVELVQNLSPGRYTEEEATSLVNKGMTPLDVVEIVNKRKRKRAPKPLNS